MPKDAHGLEWPDDTVGGDFPVADAPTTPVMDIGQFYDADPRRRRSEEVNLGKSWTSADGTNYLLSWVRDTGELYLMRDMVALGARFGARKYTCRLKPCPIP